MIYFIIHLNPKGFGFGAFISPSVSVQMHRNPLNSVFFAPLFLPHIMSGCCWLYIEDQQESLNS